MPYEWIPADPVEGPPAESPPAESQPALARLRLWPHRSLPPAGFVWFIGTTAALLALPLLMLLGTPALWGILPFELLAIGGIWLALQRNTRDAALTEELTLWPDRITLTRHNPRGPRQEWRANPYWVTVQLYPDRGPVPNYVTLKGDGREVEVGAFLGPDERLTLRDQLETVLRDLR